MSQRGRKPAPNHLKVLRGTDERYVNRDEPTPAAVEGLTVPPADLPAGAQAVWRRLAPDLVDKSVLSAWDADLFRAYCVAVAHYEDLRQRIGDEYTVTGSRKQPVRSPLWAQMNDALDRMTRLAAVFGLSPADRSRLHVGPGEGPKVGAERLLD